MLRTVSLIEGEPHRFEREKTRAGGEAFRSEPLLDFKFLLGVLRRRILMIFAILVASVVVALGLFAVTPPTYEASARIVLDTPHLDPFGDDAIFAGAGQDNPEIESQIQVMRSPYLIAQVVDRLALDQNQDFLATFETPLRSWIGERVDELRVTVFGEAASDAGLVGEAPELFQAAIEKIRENLSVSRIGLTYVLDVSYVSHSAQLSADISNAVAAAFIADRRDQREAAAIDASDWFTDRIAELERQALEAEQRVAEFRSSNGIFDAGNEGRLSEQQLADLNNELNQAIEEAEASRHRMDRYSEIVQSGAFSQPPPSELTTDSLAGMFELRQQLELDRTQFEQEIGAEHPATQNLARRIGNLDGAIEAEIRSLHTQAAAEHQAAAMRQTSAQTRYDDAIAGAQDMSGAQVRLQALESEAQVYRTLHDEYLQGYLQTIQQRSFPGADARVIEAALPPDHISSPRLSWMVLIAATVGTATGIGLAFAGEFVDRRVRSQAQLAVVTGLPVLGLLPKSDRLQRSARGLQGPTFSVPKRANRPGVKYHNLPSPTSLLTPAQSMTRTIDDPVSTYAETLRKVRIEAEHESPGGGHVVAFISDAPNASRSLAAVNYAEMLALGGARTLLVDLDWRTGFLSRSLTPNATAGLANFLAGDVDSLVASELWTDERTALQFLPNRSMAADDALDPAILDTERLKAALSKLGDAFRYVVVDMSCLAESSDASGLSDQIDAYVLVAAWGETSIDGIENELDRCLIPQAKIVGSVLTDVEEGKLSKYERVSK